VDVGEGDCLANSERWKVALDTIKICSGKPTEEDIKALRGSTDTNVDDGEVTNWYVLTRKNQGSALRVLQSGYFNGTVRTVDSELANNFSNEWGYAIDFDSNKFRVFIGPNERHDLGCALDAVPDTMFENDWIVAFNSNEEKKRASESVDSDDDDYDDDDVDDDDDDFPAGFVLDEENDLVSPDHP
jgi:hypothetical protein